MRPIRIQATWLGDPAFGAVIAAILAAGGDVRVAGGAVRDSLLGRPVQDIDLATTLVPEATAAAAKEAGLHTIPTGIDHGTVTVMAGGRGFETTTLRADIETHGRRATVRFTTDWREDAQRRDFTMNALYLDPDGTVHDPLGQGLDDIQSRTIRFIGLASERIREDRLRILRFFRFHAVLDWPIRDMQGRDACAELAPGLNQLSVERIWQEMRKLLVAPDPSPMLVEMAAAGVLAVIAPEIRADRHLPPEPDAVLRLAALLDSTADASAIAQRWRLSRAETRRLVLAVAPAGDALADPVATRRALYHDGRQAMADRMRLATARGDVVNPAITELVGGWPVPTFPLTGRDLIAVRIAPGREMGQLLRRLEAQWIADDFRADRETCLGWLAGAVRALADPESSPPTD